MLDGIKFYGSATVGTKGQIVIPAEAREELGVNEGDKLVILREPHGSGFIALKAEMLEKIVEHMQSKFQTVAKVAKEFSKEKEAEK